MYSEREASIVRFFAADNTVVGAGFLVAADTLLTCAHVVTAALRISWNQEASRAPTDPLCLDFPIVAPNRALSAHVDAQYWQPPRPDGSGDIAILRLDGNAPEGVRVVHLIQSDEDLWGHDFRVFGYPDKHPHGVWASGELRGRRTAGWIQIEDVKVPGYRIQRGFSGGAIWDDQLGGVVGMAVAADTEAANKVAYMIPTSALVSAYPQLGQVTIPACPYRGLSAFREQDEPYFFGRSSFTQQLVDAIVRKPLVAVIGSSGSGKSSAVFAGLIPRLRSRGNWLFAPFRPGNRPFYSLAAALVPLLEPQMSETDRLLEVNKQARYMQQGVLSLRDIVDTIVQKFPGMRLLLIADQFEELYTLCKEPEVRQRFLDELLAALSAPSDQDTVSFNLVLTLRADFVGQALSYRPFADALQYADLKLGPMNAQELQDVIAEPARKLHVKIEEGLTERILKEVSREPGYLPLLEFALTLLWARQKDGRLTHAGYTEISGVEKALADHAEEVYGALTEQQQLQAQRIFVQLVRPGEGTGDTRRLATRADVAEQNWGLVMRLSSARLIVTGRDTTTGEETIEVIHEALISGWQRLRDWIEESREFRTWQERLRAALRQWENIGKDSGALLRGALLVEASEWLKQRPEAISSQEQLFIEASQQHVMEEAQYLRRLLEESERERQEAERQRLIAEQQKQEAERQRQVALARGLVTQAVLYSQYDHDTNLIERSVLLSIESLRLHPSSEADQLLRARASLLRRRVGTLWHKDQVSTVAFSPDGRLVATASNDGTAGIWEVSSGKQVAMLGGERVVRAVMFSPDGRLVATASDDGTAGIWEVSGGKRVATLRHENWVTAVAFSPDGQLVTTASGDRTAGVWEMSSGKRVATLQHESGVTAVAFSPDGRLVATASGDKTAGVWEVSSGRRVATLQHESVLRTVAFSLDGRLVATASGDRIAAVWEVSSGKRVATLGHRGGVYAVVLSLDGRLIATASDDRTAGVWEVSSGKRVATLRHEGWVYAVAFSPDGRLVATASDDRTAGIWEVSGGKRVATLGHQSVVTAVAFSPDGRLIATASDDRTAGLWVVSSSKQVAMLGNESVVTAVAFSPDGRLVATACDDGTAGVWEMSSGKRVAVLEHESGVYGVAFSPDGRLVATASGDRTAGVWEVSSGKRVATLEHESVVYAVAFSPDDRLVATGSNDKIARIWQVDSGQQLVRLIYEDSVGDVAFSPDGKYLATASGNTVGIWLWRPEDLIADVRPKLTRNLTPEEWKQFLGDEPYRKTFEDLP